MCGEQVKKPDELVDMMELYKSAHKHQVEAITYEALKKADFSIDSQVLEKFEQAYKMAWIKDAAQEANFSHICDLFEKNKIDFIPLKGIVLKKLYPSSHLRQSADIDLYVDDKHTEAVCRIMKENGFYFNAESIGFGMHDKYVLNKLVNIEVHRYLLERDMKKWYMLGQVLVDNAKQEQGCLYTLTKEDHYIYVLLHAVKHLRYTGIGIKIVLDIWVYLKKYASEMDWDYINKTLKEYELCEIEGNLKSLVEYWFDSKPCENPIVKELSDYVVTNGGLISKSQADKSVVIEKKPVERAMRAFFMPYKEMAIKYKILKTMPFLLPAMWVYRAGYSVIKKDTLRKELTRYKQVDKDEVNRVEEFKKRIGIK